MRDAYVEEALNRFVPQPAEAGDWEDVLRRAGARTGPRRGRLVLVVAILVLVLGLAIPIAVSGPSIVPFFPEPEDVVGEPVPTGPRVLLASGEISGTRWTLSAYTSDQGLCVDLAHFDPNWSAGGCGFDVRGEEPSAGGHWVGLTVTTPGDLDVPGDFDGAVVFGPAEKGVATVEIVLRDGRTVTAEIIEGPAELGAPINFYLAQLAPSAGVLAVVARDADGRVLERREIG